MTTAKFTALFVALAMLLVLQSCTPPAFVARSTSAPAIKYCNDAAGHIKGAVPFSLNGTCCCTPTQDHYKRCLDEKTIDPATSYTQFVALYTSKGIMTDLDHKGCNNMCEYGPHVVFGGRCMATPTPGTLNYERVTSGIQQLTLGDATNEKGL